MSNEPDGGAHDFMVKTGVVFRGRVESETATDIVLDVGKDARSIITLSKSYVVTRDGVPYPPRPAEQPREAHEPLVLVDQRSYSNEPVWVVLFFEAPAKGAVRAALDSRVPPPLRHLFRWVAPEVLLTTTDEYFELDVRIAYNADARALFAEKKVDLFDVNRFDILTNGGIDNEPEDSEMEAFGADIVSLIDAAHVTEKLALAYVSFAAPFPAIERLASEHVAEARRAAFACLARLWTANETRSEDRVLLQNTTYTVLSAVAHDRLLFGDDERASARELFERLAERLEIDEPWQHLRTRLGL